MADLLPWAHIKPYWLEVLSMADYRSNHRSRRPKAQNTEADAVEAVLKVIGQIFLAVYRAITGAKGQQADKARLAEIKEYWGTVEMYLYQAGREAMAVSEADKLLDAALQAWNTPGSTLGERLKAAQGRFPADLYQQIWEAHKLRNVLAHEVGSQVDQAQARQAVAIFRSALSYLNAV